MSQMRILGQGTALPPYSASVEEAAAYASHYSCDTDEQRKRLPVLYRMSGVKRRHSVLLEAPEGAGDRQSFFPERRDADDVGPGIGARMIKYHQEAIPLAAEACREALKDSGCAPDSITHIVTVSCSGFSAPGVDIGLIKALGLKPTVQRTHVGFMGCHGALNGLRVARGLTHSDPNARVLVCAVELCSLHYHYGWNPERIVANALFADGAAALVCGPEGQTGENTWHMAGSGSCLFPNSEDCMTWKIYDHGFVMTLSPRVPDLIAAHLKEWLVSWLGELDFDLKDIASWAVHPGGPRILLSVAKALGLEKEATDVSRDVLRECGNMSSPTVLFILKRLREQNAPRPCVALGFGPGLVAEATLFV